MSLDETFARLRGALIAFAVPAPATTEAVSSRAAARGLAAAILHNRIEEDSGATDPRVAVETAIALFGAG